MKSFLYNFWELLLGLLFVLIATPCFIVYGIEAERLKTLEINNQIELFGYYNSNIQTVFVNNDFEFLSIIGFILCIMAIPFVFSWFLFKVKKV